MAWMDDLTLHAASQRGCRTAARVCTQARLWDVRLPSRPLVLAELGAGGGVWRLKWHPWQPQLLLAACMHGGCAVLAADEAAGGLQEVLRYAGHGSLAYGADWWRGGGGCGGAGLAATCSFYDRRLHLWEASIAGR